MLFKCLSISKNIVIKPIQARFLSNKPDIGILKELIGKDNVKTEEIEIYNEDWLRIHQGN